MIDETSKSPDYIEIGEYLGTYLLVSWKSFIRTLKRKTNRAFKLTAGGMSIELDSDKIPAGLAPGSDVTIHHNNQYYKQQKQQTKA